MLDRAASFFGCGGTQNNVAMPAHFFEFKLELAIPMYFLCIEFFGRLPVGWAILTVDTLAKDQSKVGVFQPTHTNLSTPTLANMVSRKGARPVVAGTAVHTNHRRGKSSSCVLIPRFAGFNFCFMFVTSFFRVYWFLFRNCNFS